MPALPDASPVSANMPSGFDVSALSNALSAKGIDSDTVETISSASWLQATQLAHLVRDKGGKIAALEVSTGRIKKMRFERVE